MVVSHLDAPHQAELIGQAEIGDVDCLEVLPGARALRAALRPTATPSSLPADAASHHPPARRRLPIHPAMITASDITRGKPDPQPYLAGATVIALPSTYAQDELSGAETPSSRPEPPFRRRSGETCSFFVCHPERRTRRTARVRSRRTCCCFVIISECREKRSRPESNGPAVTGN